MSNDEPAVELQGAESEREGAEERVRIDPPWPHQKRGGQVRWVHALAQDDVRKRIADDRHREKQHEPPAKRWPDTERCSQLNSNDGSITTFARRLTRGLCFRDSLLFMRRTWYNVSWESRPDAAPLSRQAACPTPRVVATIGDAILHFGNFVSVGAAMILTIRTTHQPATDLGYLLHKN